MFAHFEKNKALLYGGGIFAVIVLVLLFRRLSGGSASTVSTVTTGVDPATLQAQTSLALAQIGAATAAQQTNAQVVAQQSALQEDLAKTTIAADVTKYATDAQTQQLTIQTAAASASDARNAELQASIAKWTLEQAAQVNANNNAFQLEYAANANATAEATTQMNDAIVAQQISANQNVTIASLTAQTAQMASFVNSQTQMNDSNNAKDIAIANQNNQTARHGQSTSLIGSIIGGALSLFSDRRLKTDIILLGVEGDGLGIYSYRYHDDPSYQIGVIAQEVKRLRPHAMGPIIEGHYTVDYAAL